jgi:hypothetical protein
VDVNPITVRYTLVPTDLREFMRHAEKKLSSVKRSKLIMLCMLALICAWIVAYLTEYSVATRVAIFAVLLGLYWGFTRVLTMFVSKLAHLQSFTPEKHKSVLCDHTLTLSEVGIHNQTQFGESRIIWSAVYRVVENADYIYLFLTAHSAYIVPKRAFPNDEAAKQFFNTAIQLLANSQNSAATVQ